MGKGVFNVSIEMPDKNDAYSFPFEVFSEDG